MGIPYNSSGAFVPVRERRENSALLTSLNATCDLELNGDSAALVYVNAGAPTLTATLAFLGTVDGTNFFPILAVPYNAVGNVPSYGQSLISEVISTTNVQRVYALRVGQLKKMRVQLTAFTTGGANVTIVSDTSQSLHPAAFDGRPSTLLVTATAALGATITATLPVVTGLRHYIDFISVVKFNGAALTAAATPVLVTTTNLPGNPVINFPAEAGAQGVDTERRLDWGGTGCAAAGPGVATTVVCPATTGVIWRINAGYRLGL